MAEIAAARIVAGEANFDPSLVEAREHADEMRRWREERDRVRREELTREWLGCLEQSGALLRKADDLLALIERVSRALTEGGLALAGDGFRAWRTWAFERADELDPVRSGQVHTARAQIRRSERFDRIRKRMSAGPGHDVRGWKWRIWREARAWLGSCLFAPALRARR